MSQVRRAEFSNKRSDLHRRSRTGCACAKALASPCNNLSSKCMKVPEWMKKKFHCECFREQRLKAQDCREEGAGPSENLAVFVTRTAGRRVDSPEAQRFGLNWIWATLRALTTPSPNFFRSCHRCGVKFGIFSTMQASLL